MNRVFIIGLIFFCAACSASSSGGEVKTVVVQQSVNELELEKVPGTQNDIYVEPMYDSPRVPGQLDPKGVYYRAPHRTLVEIRRGKYQQVQYPDYGGKYLGEK